MTKKKEAFKCEKRGCKTKTDELYCNGPYGIAKDKRWFCKECFKTKEEK